MCSFCVRLCGWTRSLCLSALPSFRAPDEVIRTGVARLHCLYLAGVSVVRCQIVVTIVVPYLCNILTQKKWCLSGVIRCRLMIESIINH